MCIFIDVHASHQYSSRVPFLLICVRFGMCAYSRNIRYCSTLGSRWEYGINFRLYMSQIPWRTSFVLRSRHELSFSVVPTRHNAHYLLSGMPSPSSVARTLAISVRLFRSATAFSYGVCTVVGFRCIPRTAETFVSSLVRNSLELSVRRRAVSVPERRAILSTVDII